MFEPKLAFNILTANKADLPATRGSLLLKTLGVEQPVGEIYGETVVSHYKDGITIERGQGRAEVRTITDDEKVEGEMWRGIAESFRPENLDKPLVLIHKEAK